MPFFWCLFIYLFTVLEEITKDSLTALLQLLLTFTNSAIETDTW